MAKSSKHDSTLDSTLNSTADSTLNSTLDSTLNSTLDNTLNRALDSATFRDAVSAFYGDADSVFYRDYGDPNSALYFSAEAPDKTIFESAYKTHILPEWDDEEEEDKSMVCKNPENIATYLTPQNIDSSLVDTSRIKYEDRLNYAFTEHEERIHREKAEKYELVGNLNKLLEITVTSIILMARNSPNITPEHYLFAEMYLKGVNDEYGEYPKNIKGLLKHIKHLKKKNNIKLRAVSECYPQNLNVHRISKKYRDEYMEKIRNESKVNTCKINKGNRDIDSNTSDKYFDCELLKCGSFECNYYVKTTKQNETTKQKETTIKETSNQNETNEPTENFVSIAEETQYKSVIDKT